MLVVVMAVAAMGVGATEIAMAEMEMVEVTMVGGVRVRGGEHERRGLHVGRAAVRVGVERGERAGAVERSAVWRDAGGGVWDWSGVIGRALPLRLVWAGAGVGAQRIGGAVRVSASRIDGVGGGGAAEL